MKPKPLTVPDRHSLSPTATVAPRLKECRRPLDVAVAEAVSQARPWLKKEAAAERQAQDASLEANIAAWHVGKIVDDLVAETGKYEEALKAFTLAAFGKGHRTADYYRSLYLVTGKDVNILKQHRDLPRTYWLDLATMDKGDRFTELVQKPLLLHPLKNKLNEIDPHKIHKAKRMFVRAHSNMKTAGLGVAAEAALWEKKGDEWHVHVKTQQAVDDITAFIRDVNSYERAVSNLVKVDRTTAFAVHGPDGTRRVHEPWTPEKPGPGEYEATREVEALQRKADALYPRERRDCKDAIRIEHLERGFIDLQVRHADAVVMDIPYDLDFIDGHIRQLAECCKRWLRPNGIAAIMGGSIFMDKIIREMTKDDVMYWRWCMAYRLVDEDGESSRGKEPDGWPWVLNSSFKTVLCFAPTQDRSLVKIQLDMVDSGPPEKTFGEHQQDVPGFERLIAAITPPHGLVVDGTCGWGTTGVACVRTGRQFRGCDTKVKRVEIARLRCLAEWADKVGLTASRAAKRQDINRRYNKSTSSAASLPRRA